MLPVIQKFMPQHTISNIAGYLANCENKFIKNLFIKNFIKHYPINMSEAKITDPLLYKSFNHFFTRELKKDARIISDSNLVSPCDGAISQIGQIKNNKIIQAKGRDYSVKSLLANEELANIFSNGDFATIYLAPSDYHRVHLPMNAILREMTYIPGKLFSVNNITANSINNLFAINERIVTVFDTEHGKIAMVLVGAMIVGSMETIWAGTIDKKNFKALSPYKYTISLKKGEEIGRFKLGSTVILLTENNLINLNNKLKTGDKIKLGEEL